MELKEIAEALSHLGDKGSDAFIAWVWMRALTSFSASFTVITLASIVARTVFVLTRRWQALTACPKCWPHFDKSYESGDRLRQHREKERCDDRS